MARLVGFAPTLRGLEPRTHLVNSRLEITFRIDNDTLWLVNDWLWLWWHRQLLWLGQRLALHHTILDPDTFTRHQHRHDLWGGRPESHRLREVHGLACFCYNICHHVSTLAPPEGIAPSSPA